MKSRTGTGIVNYTLRWLKALRISRLPRDGGPASRWVKLGAAVAFAAALLGAVSGAARAGTWVPVNDYWQTWPGITGTGIYQAIWIGIEPYNWTVQMWGIPGGSYFQGDNTCALGGAGVGYADSAGTTTYTLQWQPSSDNDPVPTDLALLIHVYATATDYACQVVSPFTVKLADDGFGDESKSWVDPSTGSGQKSSGWHLVHAKINGNIATYTTPTMHARDYVASIPLVYAITYVQVLMDSVAQDTRSVAISCPTYTKALERFPLTTGPPRLP